MDHWLFEKRILRALNLALGVVTYETTVRCAALCANILEHGFFKVYLQVNFAEKRVKTQATLFSVILDYAKLKEN